MVHAFSHLFSLSPIGGVNLRPLGSTDKFGRFRYGLVAISSLTIRSKSIMSRGLKSRPRNGRTP